MYAKCIVCIAIPLVPSNCVVILSSTIVHEYVPILDDDSRNIYILLSTSLCYIRLLMLGHYVVLLAALMLYLSSAGWYALLIVLFWIATPLTLTQISALNMSSTSLTQRIVLYIVSFTSSPPSTTRHEFVVYVVWMCCKSLHHILLISRHNPSKYRYPLIHHSLCHIRPSSSGCYCHVIMLLLLHDNPLHMPMTGWYTAQSDQPPRQY